MSWQNVKGNVIRHVYNVVLMNRDNYEYSVQYLLQKQAISWYRFARTMRVVKSIFGLVYSSTDGGIVWRAVDCSCHLWSKSGPFNWESSTLHGATTRSYITSWLSSPLDITFVLNVISSKKRINTYLDVLLTVQCAKMMPAYEQTVMNILSHSTARTMIKNTVF